MTSITPKSYAERLGWQPHQRIVLFNVDDAGMSNESNRGTLMALQAGIARSASMMMPCNWIPGLAMQLQAAGITEMGIHLTHTAEWQAYRWGPLSGSGADTLTDRDGAFHRDVGPLLQHADISQLELEIDAQITRARRLGLGISHLDTHMGALWASAAWLQLYVNTGIREKIPVLLPAGHASLLQTQTDQRPLRYLQHNLAAVRRHGESLWQAGLAVVDDLYVAGYDWPVPQAADRCDATLRTTRSRQYMQLLDKVQPGITVIATHCTDAGEPFKQISDSGASRKADLLAMTDPALKQYIEEKQIILTGWHELNSRRLKAAN